MARGYLLRDESLAVTADLFGPNRHDDDRVKRESAPPRREQQNDERAPNDFCGVACFGLLCTRHGSIRLRPIRWIRTQRRLSHQYRGCEREPLVLPPPLLPPR